MMQHVFTGASILFPLIMADLNLGYTEFGVAIAASSLIGGMFQTFFGIVSRRISRHILLGFGNILLSFGTFLIGLAHNFVDFLNAKMVANIGTAPQHPLGTALVTERLDSQSIGRTVGIFYGLAYTGNIIGPLLMTFFAVMLGWRSTFFLFSIPALIIGLIVIWYLNEDRKLTYLSKPRNVPSLASDIIKLAKTKSVIPIIIAQALVSGGTCLGVIVTYTPLFLADTLALGVYERGIMYTIGLSGGVVGPVLLGKYADSFGHLQTATLSTLIAFIFVFLLPLHSSASLILVFHLFVLGFGSFALPSLLQSHLVRHTQEYERDLVVGIFFTVGIGFSSLWTGIMGYIIDVYSSFTPAFILMGTLGLIAFLVLAYQARKIQR